MSSEIEGVALIAAAVALPAVAAFGAGWLAWQSGKLLLGANAAIDREIEERQRVRQEAQRQRKLAAAAARQHLAAACAGVLEELDTLDGIGPADRESIRQELRQICEAPVPDSAEGMESMNALDAMRLERILDRQNTLKKVRLSGSGTYDGLAVADLMEDLRLALSAARIAQTAGADVRAADPRALERAELNRRLAAVGARVMEALGFVVDLSENYGLSDANDAWFRSCFSGVDEKIGRLCSPAVSNKDLRRGIQSLEETLERFDMLSPSLKREAEEVSVLYPVYAEAARALGETVLRKRDFRSAADLEAELERLRKRAERARVCAEIYQKLGPEAYMCYAWDEELRAMGYTVHTRGQITDMAGRRPEHARLGDAEMPFYQWNRDELTQIYHIGPECDLQLIMHADGTVSMETIARSGDREKVVQVQRAHCAGMQTLRRRLRENWFLLYDCEETASAEQLRSDAQWRASERNPWTGETERGQTTGVGTGVRENVRTESQRVMRRE